MHQQANGSMTCCNSRQKIPEVVALSLAHQIKTLQCALAAAFSLQGRGLEDAAAVVATSAMFAAVSVSPPGPLAPARPAAEMCSGLAAGAPYAWPALRCAPGEGAWLLGGAALLDALLPRGCLPL